MKKLLTAITTCALAVGISACSSTPEQPQRPDRTQQRPDRTQQRPPSFAELDRNNDGKLNRDEFNKLPVARRAASDEMFNRADRDGDGYVDRNEFMTFREHLRKQMEERRG
jgi:Ca2+-binding EF-hand superfamily protein